jgi:hypothetical protein
MAGPFQRIDVEGEVGAVSVICTIRGRRGWYGLTANHVLIASDGTVDDNDAVEALLLRTNTWERVGVSREGMNFTGSKIAPNQYGRFDAGIFEIAREGLVKPQQLEVANVNPDLLAGDPRRLVGLRVNSYSVMYDRLIQGTIVEVFAETRNGTPFDIVVESEDDRFITRKGDSGLCWFDHNGNIISLHTNGDNKFARFSFSTLITRIFNAFDIGTMYRT